MIRIQDTIVSLDLIEQYFCCDLDKCLGECCIQGDSGAPVTPSELETIKTVLPHVSEYLSPQALEIIRTQGPAYHDQDGDLVTSIVGSRDCVFTTYAPGGKCLCAFEKACSLRKISFRKPASCALYPVRLQKYPHFTAVNLHHWDICEPARRLGHRLRIRAYQFLRQPLTEYFGTEWYDELQFTASEYLRQNPTKQPLL